MREFVRSIVRRFTAHQNTVQEINHRREELAGASDATLRETGQRSKDLIETFAVTAIIAARVLGLTMFDVQLQGAWRWRRGRSPRCRPAKEKRWPRFRPSPGTRDAERAST